MSVIRTVVKSKQKSKHWFLWWKIEPEELAKQVDEYKSLKITQSARGISVLCLLLSALATGLMAYFRVGGMNEWSAVDAGLMLFLAVFIYRGHEWAMIGAMIFWTLEKLLSIVVGLQPADFSAGRVLLPVVFWAIYMHAFYLAFKTERGRLETRNASTPVSRSAPE